MPDEIDLLRAFRADTPGPDDAAWERARATVALAEDAATANPSSRRRRPRGIRGFRRGRVIVAAAVAIVAGAAAGIFPTVLREPPSLNGFAKIPEIVMDRERLKFGPYRDIAACSLVFALSAGGRFQVESSAGRAADVIAESEIGLPAVERLHAPSLNLEMVVEVSTQRVAS